MRHAFLFLLVLCVTQRAAAQKTVLSYPFEFEKSFLAKSDYNAFFLDNKQNESFALVLKDNKKAEYALFDKNFKTLSKITVTLENSALDRDAIKYIGGATNNNVFHFVYGIAAKRLYELETVDFNTKTIQHKKIETLSKDLKYTVFSSNNTCYFVAADDAANKLVVQTLNATGVITRYDLPFTVPSGASKRKLSGYLQDVQVFKEEEDPDLSLAVKHVKLFASPQKLQFVINDGDNPTHIFSISLPDMKTEERFVSYNDVVGKEERGKVYISSFLESDFLYSLVLNKKNIRITVHDLLNNNNLRIKHEINDNAENYNLFAEQPVAERRLGKRVSAKDVDGVKQLIKAFTNGTEGLMVRRLGSGKLLLTAGTYDLIPMSSGVSTGGGYSPGYQLQYTNAGAKLEYNPFMYYTPGVPSYTKLSARYYNTTYFKCLFDPLTFKPARGRVPMSVADQVKDYMEDADKKLKATNQFAVGKNQYYGFYDRDLKSYVVEQIRIF